MTYLTHLTAGAAALTWAAETEAASFPEVTALFAVGALAGSLAPDVDEHRSWIGRRLPVVSHMLSLVFGHRGATHSAAAVLLLWGVYMLFPLELTAGLLFGYIVHLLCDLCSVRGIPVLLPLSKTRWKIPLYRTGGWIEWLLLAVMLGWLFHVHVMALPFL
ncbi:metal-dependent hydrolase [Alkalicoccus chagannorensis]|uniref:metal-dependent hydrolase n=1 Tax=Alkalicoccus chagannorensis TaxID=427072 RepID=UPI00047DC487|nr:metal-dependent hydrolase [Alkalicoccus chagannorensis]